MKEIIKFIRRDEVGEREDNGLGGLGGWFGEEHSWQDYEEQYNEVGRPLIIELRDKLISHGISCTGQQMQEYAKCIPVWEDGTVTLYSWRGWGDLMAAVANFQDGQPHCYMEFYM